MAAFSCWSMNMATEAVTCLRLIERVGLVIGAHPDTQWASKPANHFRVDEKPREEREGTCIGHFRIAFPKLSHFNILRSSE